MTIEITTLLSTLPPVLVLLAGFLILHAGQDENAARDLLFYLLAIGAAFALALFVFGLISARQNSPAAWMANLLLPALIGVLTLLVINFRYFKKLKRPEKILFIVLSAAMMALLVGLGITQSGGVGMMLVPGALLLALFWTFGSKSTGAAFTFGLLALVSLAMLNSDTLFPLDSRFPRWLSTAAGILATIGPVLAVALAAIFITRGLQELAGGTDRKFGRSILRTAAWLLLSFALLGYLAYTISWAAIWDQTSDGFGGVWFSTESTLAAVGAGMVMGLTSHGRRRAAGIAFAVLAPLLLSIAAHPKWLIYHTITDDRAASIQQAVEGFQARNGRYPAELNELIPRDLLWVPNPVIFRGEDWCYQAGDYFYRLGTVYREFFSAPISVHVYASRGEAPAGWDCDQRASRLQERYKTVGERGPNFPLETPLPPSLAPVEEKTANLLLKAGEVYLGDWSPDGAYLVFGIPQGGGYQQEIELAFLNAKTGQVCKAPGHYTVPADIRGQYAWLPDGRLFFLPLDGNAFSVWPCQEGIKQLADRFPDTMTGIIRPTQKNPHARVLLKNAASFWILDGTDMSVLKVQGVTPTSYELRWDQASWSPSGDRLAISRLNGREKKDGATLSIVSTATGQVEHSQAVQAIADQSPPRVEWVSEHEILLDGQGDTLLIDMNTSPFKVTRVMRDLFSLDVAMPNDISAWGSFVDPSGSGYHLAVRLNLPRNKAVYVYHSENGQVEVLRPEGHAVLLFSGGDWAQFMKMETPPAYRDEFELFWIDGPIKASQLLKVQGHTPRSYPDLYGSYLPVFQEIAYSSSQGVSLVSIMDGKTIGFWRLGGRTNNIQPSLVVSPDGRYLVVIAMGDGVYGIRVER